MADHQEEISEDRLYVLEREDLALKPFDGDGLVLDLGGGGEGIVGKLGGERVVAIDPNRRELEEAPPGPLKIVMDASDLGFVDQSFSLVTSFYTLMYIGDEKTRRRVFSEAYRVLAPEGRFLIWDAVVPPRGSEKRDILVVWLNVRLPAEDIEAKYGMVWPEGGRSSADFTDLATGAGFEVTNLSEQGKRICLQLLKSR